MTLQEKIQKKAVGYGQLAPTFIEGAEFALENQWVNVEDDLPCNHEELLERNNETVLVIVKCKRFINVDYMILYGERWIWLGHNDCDITRWMPIPQLPKEQEIKL